MKYLTTKNALCIATQFQKESKGILILFKYLVRVSGENNVLENGVMGLPTIGFRISKMTLIFYIQNLS